MLKELINSGNNYDCQYLMIMEKYVQHADNDMEYYYDYNCMNYPTYRSMAMIKAIHDADKVILKYLQYDVNVGSVMYKTDDDILKISKCRKIMFKRFENYMKDEEKMIEEINEIRRILSLTKIYVVSNKLLFDILVNEKLDDKFEYKIENNEITYEITYIIWTRKYIFADELLLSLLSIKAINYFITGEYGRLLGEKKLDIIKHICPISKRLNVIYILMKVYASDCNFCSDENYEKLIHMFDYYAGMSNEMKKYLGMYEEKQPGIKINSTLHDVRFVGTAKSNSF